MFIGSYNECYEELNAMVVNGPERYLETKVMMFEATRLSAGVILEGLHRTHLVINQLCGYNSRELTHYESSA